MDHLAIMKSSWKLIPKILSGEKTIESRWYKARFSPWNRIEVGDNIYFKDSGKPITATARVENILQFEHPRKKELLDLLETYAGNPGICLNGTPQTLLPWAKTRPYIILLFLKNPRAITPFEINKTGFGNACAWMTVETIDSIKKANTIPNKP